MSLDLAQHELLALLGSGKQGKGICRTGCARSIYYIRGWLTTTSTSNPKSNTTMVTMATRKQTLRWRNNVPWMVSMASTYCPPFKVKLGSHLSDPQSNVTRESTFVAYCQKLNIPPPCPLWQVLMGGGWVLQKWHSLMVRQNCRIHRGYAALGKFIFPATLSESAMLQLDLVSLLDSSLWGVRLITCQPAIRLSLPIKPWPLGQTHAILVSNFNNSPLVASLWDLICITSFTQKCSKTATWMLHRHSALLSSTTISKLAHYSHYSGVIKVVLASW